MQFAGHAGFGLGENRKGGKSSTSILDLVDLKTGGNGGSGTVVCSGVKTCRISVDG